MTEFYSHGKLLLTGEYAVLDGAKALAIPTKFGQHLRYKKTGNRTIQWKSLDDRDHIWFTASFEPGNFKIIAASDFKMADTLSTILQEAKKSNTDFLEEGGYDVETRLTFHRDWGLGSSSTLVNNIAQWANVDPYQLLQKTFGGSGYDIACAQSNTPILYQLGETLPKITKVTPRFPFDENLFFVHLNKKQNSREAIASYRDHSFDKGTFTKTITEITEKMVSTHSLREFEQLMKKHETVVSEVLQILPVKKRLFPDYKLGEIKSLGAWGGDFILVTGNEKTPGYFESKGFETIFSYLEMVLDH
ncbi:GHMP kinase [Muricauda sp. SCSIO 65647]|nr:GHMP kinase [Muricauda sp. SCSIO 65647]